MDNIVLESIGYTRTVLNKSFLYKMVYNNKQYLVTKQYHDYYFKLYNNKFEFENIEFEWGFVNDVEDLIRNIKQKKNIEIDIDDIENYFEKIKTKPSNSRRVNRMFSSLEINSLFEYLAEVEHTTILKNDYIKMVDDFDLSYSEKEAKTQYYKKITSSLIGYTLTLDCLGDHKNDGQLVDYVLTITSPKGKITTIETEMCLMVGWNYYNEIKIL